MEALFDVGPYVVPVDEIVQAPMVAEDWIVIADQMHDERKDGRKKLYANMSKLNGIK